MHLSTVGPVAGVLIIIFAVLYIARKQRAS